MGCRSVSQRLILPSYGQISPPVGGEPTAANTGPAAGVTLTTVTGDVTLNDGDHLSARHITGTVYQQGSNCSLTDCVVDGGVVVATLTGWGGAASAASNLTLTRVRTSSLFNTGGFNGVTINASWFGADGINDTVSQLVDSTTRTAAGLIVRDSYFYGRPDYNAWTVEHGGPGDPHWEAAHWAGVSGLDITNTVFDIQPKNGPSDTTSMSHITASMTFQDSWTGTGAQCSGNFSGNHLYGGGAYQIYLNLVGGSTFNNNAFHSNTGATPYTIAIGNPSFTASGNTLDGNPYAVTT